MATILIADDREVDRHSLATLLSHYGHRIVEVGDGGRALEAALAERPDLIISDVLMPTIDGYELVRRLREIPEIAQTPVIFYTAMYHEHEVVTLARQCGVTAVMTKPSEPEAIVATVDAVLGRTSTAPNPPPPTRVQSDNLQAVTAELAEKVRALEASEQRLAAVVSLGHRFTGQADPDELIRDVCEATRGLTLAEQAVAGIIDASRTAVTHFFATGQTAGADSGDASMFEGPSLKSVLDDRMPIRMSGVDSRVPRRAIGTQLEIRSYLAVPIASATRVYGWIGLINKLGADAFSDRDEQVAVMVGLQAGTSYEKGLLVDDLRRHATALRASEKRTHYALSAARMGIWEIDLRTDRVAWSPSMAEVFGLAPDRSPTTNEAFNALIHPDDRQTLTDALERAVGEGTEYEVEFRALLPSGDARWMAGQARLVRDADGNPLRMLGVGMDKPASAHQSSLVSCWRSAGNKSSNPFR